MLACTYFYSEVCVFVKMIQVTKMCESVKYKTAGSARKWVIRDARRMCAYMGNTVYAIRCVCLYILCSGGHTGFVSFFIQDKNRERSEHKQAARETSTLLWGKEKSKRTKNHVKTDFLHFFCKKFVYIKKKQYLCTRNQ